MLKTVDFMVKWDDVEEVIATRSSTRDMCRMDLSKRRLAGDHTGLCGDPLSEIFAFPASTTGACFPARKKGAILLIFKSVSVRLSNPACYQLR